MEFETPDWLNKEFIRDSLQGGNATSDKSIVVESINVDKPIAKGDNYASDVFRATVSYWRQDDNKNKLSTSLIIKAPKVGGMSDFILQWGILQKEVKIYNEYIPKINDIFGDEKTLTPKLYYCNRENVLVLEDLKIKEYVMADRRAQLDFEHSSLALKALATFHAASVKVYEDDPQLVEEVGKEMFFSERLQDMNKQYTIMNFNMMIHTAKNNKNLERYADKLVSHAEKAWDILEEMLRPKEDSLNVLNHGDFWINNVLFKYDENKKPIDLKILDLQVARYARPSFDILYFLYTSVQEDVRLKSLDKLLKIYVDELNLKLENFGISQRLTDSQLKSMLTDCEFFGLFVSISAYPIIAGDPKDGVIDVSEVTEDELKNLQTDLDKSPFAMYYKNERFLKVIADRFAEFDKREWF